MLGTSGVPLTVTSLSTNGNITLVGSSVTINGLVESFGPGKKITITASTGGITFGTAGRTIAAGDVALSAVKGTITSTNPNSTVTATNLALTASGNSALKTRVASVSGTVSSGSLSLTEFDALSLGTLAGKAITLSLGGALTQTGKITGTTLSVTNTSGTVSLTNSGNDVDQLSVSNGSRPVAFTDVDDLAVGTGGITGGDASGGIGVDITATSLTATNAITSGIPGAGDGHVRLTATTGNIAVSAPITAKDDTITLDARFGQITRSGAGAIDCNTFVWFATATPSFPQPPSVFTTVVPNLTPTGDLNISYTGVPIGDVFTLNGNITITGSNVVIAGIVRTNGTNKVIRVTSNTGGILFQPGGQVVNPLGSVQMTAAGTVAVGVVTAGTTLTVTTTANGGLDVGPNPNGLLKAGTTLDLRNVSGTIGTRNGGQITGATILLPPGKGIQVGGDLTTVADLNQAITTINSLPAITGARYEIVVAANMILTQTITVNRPISLRGTSQAITLTGTPTVRTGLSLGSTSNGSNVRDLTFAGFADDAIRLTDNTGTSISGLVVRDSGFGLTLSGRSTGTTVRTNTFNRNATAIRLLSATGALIGGSAAGQGNMISNGRVGVFASGFCTRSQVVRNRITGTLTPYDVRSSRNLTVVQ